MALYKKMYAVTCEVYEPQQSVSIYDDDDQVFDYNAVADFEGDLLITGLNELRFGSWDEWSPPEVKLYVEVGAEYIPNENAKIVINEDDNVLSLRVLNKRTITGQHLELIYIFELVPFN